MIGVTTLPQRLGEVGRIRLGDEKIDPRRPGPPLEHFRVTVAEHDRSILEDVTAVYGGEVKPWKDNDGSPAWQAILAAESIDVAIPPDDSALSMWYEQWRGGYCVVRCNGTRCQRPVGKGAAAHWEESACSCEQGDPDACGLVTRLNVVLLGVPAYGLFRLDTGSIHAARTFPAVVAMAQQLAHEGRPVPATLAIQAKTTKNLGRPTPKQQFKIPVLRLAVGLTRETMLGAGPETPLIEGPKETPAAAPPPPEAIPPDEDGVIDAELLTDVDREIADWQDRFEAATTPPALTALVAVVQAEASAECRDAAKRLLVQVGQRKGWAFDRAAKAFKVAA